MLLDKALVGSRALTRAVTTQGCVGCIQLTFDDISLSIFGRLTVKTPRGSFNRKDKGCSDALQALIGQHVVSIEYVAHKYSRIRFTTGVLIEVDVSRPPPRYVNGREVICLSESGVPSIVKQVA